MGVKTEELIDVLDELAALLESDGDTHWSAWMRKARARLLDSDLSGADYLLSAYGGMGSFNDVVLGQTYTNGVLAYKSGYGELNQRFSVLSGKAWELAKAILHSQG
ncbi:hypothetical protein BZK31_13295 [Pseudomonas floridensis]|uniref:DUF6966 domain-containing protein n=1 Tax=Pseudomonas floridensis TaxID=1958950 RepID=A0A1X0N5Q0_9PSED|nr:hypothetical protein [Pseudomonas floridensis]ORC58770.1 hypothetical protein BZK31_13295 [Pseudomonas floridensis]